MSAGAPRPAGGCAAFAAAADHACACWPLESCGVVVRSAGGACRYLPVRNVAADPARRFELDPAEQLAIWRRAAAGEFALVALVHSHPDGTADFSAADRAAATTAAGRPLHPGVDHWVLAIHGPAPRLVEARAFTWSAGRWSRQASVCRPACCSETAFPL